LDKDILDDFYVPVKPIKKRKRLDDHEKESKKSKVSFTDESVVAISHK
jgi:hypothetical protein